MKQNVENEDMPIRMFKELENWKLSLFKLNCIIPSLHFSLKQRKLIINFIELIKQGKLNQVLSGTAEFLDRVQVYFIKFKHYLCKLFPMNHQPP